MGIRISGDNNLWPDCVVPFEIDDGDFPVGSQNRQAIVEAINHWNSRTPIKFVALDGHVDFALFRIAEDDGTCGSPVGFRNEGPQDISCAVGDGLSKGVVIHEMGHAIGLWHEHSRFNKIGFVTLHSENIKDGKEHNFDQHITDGDDLFEYDYDSIMHYGRKAFSKNGKDTLTPTDPDAEIGQRNGLSSGDIDAVQNMYGILLTPHKISFGLVAVKDIRTRSFKIENPTPTPINVSFSKLVGPFLGSSPTVIPGSSVKTVVVEFAPQGEGFAKGSVTIESDASGCPRVITLTGTGTEELPPL